MFSLFFFFEKLYNIPQIEQAFKNICIDKMLADDYFDMSIYIFGRMKKDDIHSKLAMNKSKYAVLYEGPYPKQGNANEIWNKKIRYAINDNEAYDFKLTQDESIAIVNWVYRALPNSKERETFTKEFFENIEEFNSIRSSVRFEQGVVYNNAKVEINFLQSLSAVNNFITSLKLRNQKIFYRGHANANYILQPSVMRTLKLKENESKMYNDLLIDCPNDFEKCHSHLEKLVEMQHYGLPTRLLDITRNPLVALYFACESQYDAFGELVLIAANEQEIKYPQSDTVSILSSLPVFTHDMQYKFCNWAKDGSINDEQFNKNAARLIHEVRLEKPAFQAEILKNDVLNSYIVYALKNNKRIVKQDGAFILCGLEDRVNSLEKFRYSNGGKKVIVLINNKKKMLQQLETFSINRASLFPEIESVATYIKGKYSE